MNRSKLQAIRFPVVLVKEDVGPFILILAVVIIISVYSLSWYPIHRQHDGASHMLHFLRVNGLHFSPTYNAPYYYMAIHLFSWPIKVFRHFKPMTRELFVHSSLVAGNTVLQAVFILGALALGRYLGFSWSERFLFTSLAVFLPVVQRSYFMLRPENLMLPLAPWVLVFIFYWLNLNNKDKFSRYWACFLGVSILGGLTSAQKISGVAFLLSFFTALMILWPGDKKNFKKLFIPALGIAIATVSFWIIHRYGSGVWFFQHHASKIGSYSDQVPLSLFYTLDPVKIWLEPIDLLSHHALRGSIWNILFVDFYGDYWGYGFRHYYLTYLSGELQGRVWFISRERIGLSASSLILITYLVSSTYLAIKMLKDHDFRYSKINRRRIITAVTALGGPLFLIAVSFKYYKSGSLDNFKWEYILMFLPFLYIPIIHLIHEMESKRIKSLFKAVLILCIFIGVFQSFWIPPFF